MEGAKSVLHKCTYKQTDKQTQENSQIYIMVYTFVCREERGVTVISFGLYKTKCKFKLSLTKMSLFNDLLGIKHYFTVS